MKIIFKLFYLLIISICFCNCSSNNAKNNVLAEANKPGFSDDGKTVDSLKKVYNCEGVTYDNWGDKKPKDSCLTVGFINSTHVPTMDNIDTTVTQIKAIASAINKSLENPQNYKSFNIVFIKRDTVMGQKIDVHSAGMEIPRTDL